jgi:hypothetical protein
MMPDRRGIALEKAEHMTDVHILAIDLAKRSFQVCATAAGGAVHCLKASVFCLGNDFTGRNSALCSMFGPNSSDHKQRVSTHHAVRR